MDIGECMSKYLEQLIITWAENKGILFKGNEQPQWEKFKEEAAEAEEALANGDIEHIKEELGDIVVTLIVQAHLHGLSLTDCTNKAYAKIAKRKGTTVDGVFVKESE